MGEYKKSQETRTKIIDACRTLFWENGYFGTTNRLIAGVSGVQESLISYHFQTKEKLAMLIYQEFSENLIEASKRILCEQGIDNVVVENSLSGSIGWKLLELSVPFNRFYYEISKVRIPVKNIEERQADTLYYKNLGNYFSAGLSDMDSRILSLLLVAAENELIIAKVENIIDISYDEIARRDIVHSLSMMKIDYQTINNIVDIVQDIGSRYELKMVKDFKIRIKKRL